MEITQFQKVHDHNIATVLHDTGSKKLVIFCHGFRSSSIGPNRFFVRLASLLEKKDICSLRFDQYGSGNSEGEFLESSFTDWIETTRHFVNHYYNQGYKIALVGQSMGGAAVLVSASDLQDKLTSVVAWVPGIVINPPNIQGEFMEEGGQRVRWDFWKEAYEADVVSRFKKTKIPELVFFATDDEYVSFEDQKPIRESAQPNQQIHILQNHTHSSWTYDQATDVIDKSIDFICRHMGSS